jgi:hypothetical protein
MANKCKLTFEFDNQETLNHFKLWLCESGEQQYWNWMEVREEKEDGDITAVGFRYHRPIEACNTDDYGNEFFAPDNNVIPCTSGRLDRDEDKVSG